MSDVKVQTFQMRLALFHLNLRAVRLLRASAMPVGSFVLVLGPKSTPNHPRLEGPFKILAWSKKLCCAVLVDAVGRRWRVSAARLVPYRPRAARAGNRASAPAPQRAPAPARGTKGAGKTNAPRK